MALNENKGSEKGDKKIESEAEKKLNELRLQNKALKRILKKLKMNNNKN